MREVDKHRQREIDQVREIVSVLIYGCIVNVPICDLHTDERIELPKPP